MRHYPFLAAGSLAALLTFAGCGGSDHKVHASSQDAYDNWFLQATDGMDPQDVKTLRLAQQEIKLDIMAHTNASGSAAVGEAFLHKVDGLSTHDMMELGLKDRIERLTADRDEAQRLLDTNSKMTVKPGDDTHAAVLTSHLDEERGRVDKDAADIAAAQRELQRIQASPTK